MNYIVKLLATVFFNQYFLLFVTAGLGAALGKINIKGFTLGSTGGIFVGIVVGWAMTAIAKTIAPGTAAYSLAVGIANSNGGTIVAGQFMMFFLELFICSIGLSVGKRLRAILNIHMLKLVFIGIFIPVLGMALTWGCLQIAPAIAGENYNGYQIAGLYSGSMTNTAALGTSTAVIESTKSSVQSRYQALDTEGKIRAMKAIGDEDPTNPPTELSQEQIDAFATMQAAQVNVGYTVGFPVGTVVNILAITVISIMVSRSARGQAEIKRKKGEREKNKPDPKSIGGAFKGLFYDAPAFALVMGVGIFLGSITIPLGGSAEFSLSAVGGILIAALVLGNFEKIGPIKMTQDPRVLGFIREFALLFFMSHLGLQYGYRVIAAFSSTGLMLAIMALFIEVIVIAVSFVIGRYALKMDWDLLSGAISGGCTSSVALGAALNTMEGSDEPTLGYGVSQPFAILANVLLISFFHSQFFI